ncbi:unnamed protein product [Rotaria magnacalcarata]|uniref:Uncharacterized protein n=1 Tax=Rotaria magnacalcarata TaxID=392030 RepID=A0A816GBG1_9BILA|nr:unnamed protein product [Rotaria magnacalcarata]
MAIISLVLVLFSLFYVGAVVYVYNTVDSSSVEFYDCILHNGLFYCRRPKEVINLNRSNDREKCYNEGIVHSFDEIYADNISISIILHKWKSSIEKVDQYLRYMQHPNEFDGYLCECINAQSFGKNCEYLLPTGTTFVETLNSAVSLKRFHPKYGQIYGDIICYTTLECNFGLLCLDWRDICDGAQQCMSGLDENKCDKLEFNECEDDEYRCMNGMCIPEEYFLDGEFDCLDWSDEIQYYDDGNCPIEEASAQCDDRVCPRNQWPCGDGQCITDRLQFQNLTQINSQCRNRREQYFMCETHYVKVMWTLPNGRCYEDTGYEEVNVTNRTIHDDCQYLLRCILSKGAEKHCSCTNNSCIDRLNTTCPSYNIQFPKAGILAPYILSFYYRTRNASSVGPDLFWINGTIKCQDTLIDISGAPFLYFSTLPRVEDSLCRYAKNRSSFGNKSYDQSCHSHSLTFNNRPYSSSNICSKPDKCISIYRMKDGFIDCTDKMDETNDYPLDKICSKVKRYRFRCSFAQPTCLSVTTLGNLRNDCENLFDERWVGTSAKLIDIKCNKLWKDECRMLREYIEESWILGGRNEIVEQVEQVRIPFRSYCDTFWNLASQGDENVTECSDSWVCPEEQWRCDTGQCIEAEWVLDGVWDCFDASNENDPLTSFVSDRNLRLVPYSTLKNKSINLNRTYRTSPFSSICNLTMEFPCFHFNASNPWDNLTYNRPCISRHKIGDNRIDCYGAIDERNTVTHCDQLTMLGYNFKCQSSDQCIPYWDHCSGSRCTRSSDDRFWCDIRQNSPTCDILLDSMNMCEYEKISKLTSVPYRKDKEFGAKHTNNKLRFLQFPADANISKLEADLNSTANSTQATTASPDIKSEPIAYWCNRGVGVYMNNGSIACFCPPQYYGDKCEFHTDRITVLLHLNLSQSIYPMDMNVKIVLKILVLLLFNNETITNNLFHVRPTAEMTIYSKKMMHFLYSHSPQFLQHKKQLYVNQSDILHNHPYSVRIEIYERNNSGEPFLISVWQYPLYFDYLPVYRLAKVLRLTKPTMKQNPCSSNPCNRNQDCQQLMNEKSKYICLSGSLCKPNYRGRLLGNELPCCICLFDMFGEQCNIEYDKCLPNPCQNDGSCYPTAKPDTILCLCTEGYRGSNCELKKPEIQLYINETVNHIGAVVQYFEIDFISLDLILVHQQVYRTLPTLIEYKNKRKTIPEIILVKLYSSQVERPAEFYLISVHINVTSMYATTQVNEKGRCIHIRTLMLNKSAQLSSNYSPIKYHHFCRNNTDLFCFRDDFYLCICSENHSRVECFRYDSKHDQCSHCLADGRCLKGDQAKSTDFICLCPPCHSGTHCQFNSNSFAFTLDQLFFIDLISINRKTIVRLLIILPLVLFLLALPNNLFSIITFRRQNCLRNGIGQYLLYMSIINQFNLGFLAARLIHLTINITELHSESSLDNYLCKIFSFLLTSSSRIVYWLASLVAIERVYMTLFLNGRWLRKPHIACRLIVCTVVVVLISDIHELIFIKSLFGINGGQGAMCVFEFPVIHRSTWLLFHLIISVINTMLPLFINICCTISISCILIKKKMNIRATKSCTY